MGGNGEKTAVCRWHAPDEHPIKMSWCCCFQGLAARPDLAEIPADLLQRLENAATVAPEAPAEANWRGGCVTDARPAAPGLKWPFRFGGYLEPAGTPEAPDQAVRQRPDQAMLPVQAARQRPVQATLPEGTPALPGRVQRESTPFYTPAADIRCLLAATPLATPAVRHRFNQSSISVPAKDTSREAHCATASNQAAGSGSTEQTTPWAFSSERHSTAWQEQEQATAAEQDWDDSLPETCAPLREQMPQPSVWNCQNAATGDSPGQLSAARSVAAPLLPNETTNDQASVNQAMPSVCNSPRQGTPPTAITARDRKESTGSWSPMTFLAELTPNLSRLASAAPPAVLPMADSAISDAHAVVPDQLQPAVSEVHAGPQHAGALHCSQYGFTPGSELTPAAAQAPPMMHRALASITQQPLLLDQATPLAAQQLPLPDQAASSAAQQLLPQTSGVAVQDVMEYWEPAQALALHFLQRRLCVRALSAWMTYVDGRRERW